MIYSFYGNVDSKNFCKMAYKEPFVYSMSKIGEDCDEKTIGLEVMEVIWKNDLPTGCNPRKS